jgi:hypothetical protein
MTSLRTAHYHERQKTCAVLSEGDDAQCAECFLEMTPSERMEWTPINAVQLDRYPGRTTRCCWCGERLLDPNGLPLHDFSEVWK